MWPGGIDVAGARRPGNRGRKPIERSDSVGEMGNTLAAREVFSAGLMRLEAEQRGGMASTFQRRKTEAYPEGMATGESH